MSNVNDITEEANMKGNMENNLLTCLFGFHNYSDERTIDTSGYDTHLCTICKRHGYFKYKNELERWYDYDEKGNLIHFKNNYRHEYWYEYDDKGNNIYYKDNDGHEYWKHNGKWVKVKPENWEYEKYV